MMGGFSEITREFMVQQSQLLCANTVKMLTAVHYFCKFTDTLDGNGMGLYWNREH